MQSDLYTGKTAVWRMVWRGHVAQLEANGEEDDGRWRLGQGAACGGDVGSGNRKS